VASAPAPSTEANHRHHQRRDLAAVTAGRVSGERAIVEAVGAARPDVRNIAVDLGTIR
jgi:hypothetical protein